MNQPQPLAAYFAGWAANRPARLAVAATISALATVSIEIAELVGQGALAGPLGRSTGKKGEVDEQKEIDLLANNRIVDVLRGAPVAAVASEEMDAPLLLDAKAPLIVAVDPLDGSSNIDANASIGTIFTVLPALQYNDDPSAFMQPGVNQLAGGFFVYGPQTVLVVNGRRRHADLHARPPHVDILAHASESRDSARAPANMPSTIPMRATGTTPSAPTSRIAGAARKARAVATSTCAGPVHQSPTSIASCRAAASISTLATSGVSSATVGYG